MPPTSRVHSGVRGCGKRIIANSRLPCFFFAFQHPVTSAHRNGEAAPADRPKRELKMRASLKKTLAGSLVALAIGVGLAGVVTPASAWYRGGGFHGGWGGWHGGWRGGYVGWRGGYGYGWRGYGWNAGWGWRGGCGYGAWRCGGYWGGAPVVGVGYVPAPLPVIAPAPVPVVDAPPPPPPVVAPPAPACGVVYRPVFDADGTNVGTRAVNTCQ
jgi:hypothetical protein